jgi:REP element-mobilizing transposase RayT
MRFQRGFYKPGSEGVYLHVYNHTVVMENDKYPLGEIEKTKLFNTFKRYLPKYNIKLISLVVLDNHFHTLVYCPAEKLSQHDAWKAYNKFHNTGKYKVPLNDKRINAVVEHSNNISELMREVQREFSVWFNQTRHYKRRGALWEDRFKSQLIESSAYLWGCLKYIEMNPVRANIVENAEDYNFSTFGQWHNQSEHPLQENFIQHILKFIDDSVSMDRFKQYMTGQLKLMKMYDHSKELQSQGEIEEAKKIREEIRKARIKEDPALKITLFEHFDWESKKVIGSDEFIQKKYRQWVQGRKPT